MSSVAIGLSAGLLGAAVGALAVLLTVRARPASHVASPQPADVAPAPEAPAEPAAADPEVEGPATDRLTQALDSIEQGVILYDEAGVELFRNRAARRYAEARDPLVLVEAAVEELVEAARAGRPGRREVDLFGPPAQSFAVSVLPYAEKEGREHPPGARYGALALVEDRSLQRRVETVRRDFVANISHELKTPIGALGLLAETIRDEPDSEVVDRLAQRMIDEADRAGRTIDDLLDLSRIEFGDDAEFDDVSIVAVIGEAIARIASAAENAGIGVRVDVPSTLRVHADRRQLVSALYNLLDNAVKYSPEGSEIVVAATPTDDGTGVRLTVADAGIGIPRRDLDRVFERFYRVDRARSRVTGGTGLGLAIVRHVMSNHRGEVSVDSTEGVGTVFTLEFPEARRVPDDAALPTTSERKLPGAT